MTVLIDMNLSSRWVELLETSGHRSIHWSTIGRAFDDDSTIMRHAEENGYVVLTQDLDFGSMLAISKATKPSVIQLRAENAGPEVLGEQVLEVIDRFKNEIANGALVTVEKIKTRARILPFA